jgi:two-component system sensor histidine kinase DegS
MFSTKRTPFSSGQCAGAMVLIQDAVTRTQALPLRHRNEVKASAEVQGRVAREIHDGPLQTLSGLVLRLRVMRTAGEQGTHEVLRGIEIELDHVIKEMRSLIRNSHVAYSATSLEDRIRETLTRLERTRGFTWALRWRCPEAALPNSTKEELFRVINEALANVYRHSSAKHVDVVGRMRGGALEITVRDDGVGFDVAQVLRQDIRALSFGLTNMRERVSALGGTLLLRSQPGRGARVLISVPLSRPRASKGA